MEWQNVPKPAETAEARLVTAILDGYFAIGASLPPERQLATRLGVTRGTLRETLQRLARDGWIEIRHGRPTRVRNFWQDGKLGVLGALARYPEHAPPDFIVHLLTIRELLAPAYARLAVSRRGPEVASLLHGCLAAADEPAALADADWQLHRQLAIASGNPAFTLILNGFDELYRTMATAYFEAAATRERSRVFYRALLLAAEASDGAAAERVTRQAMAESLDLWAAMAAQRERQAEVAL
jgi:GntR family negative regulator for fad regulon and positive regulator of fabA